MKNMLTSTVPFQSIRQSRVTGPSKTPKCHGSHGKFCTVTNSFDDHVPNINKNSSPAALNCRKFAENLDVSRQVWEVVETKISSDVSRVTWGDELNEMVQYSGIY